MCGTVSYIDSSCVAGAVFGVVDTICYTAVNTVFGFTIKHIILFLSLFAFAIILFLKFIQLFNGGVILSNLFGISDLHLSFGNDKPMDIFHGWENYTERLYANWNRVVKPEDTVVIAGDISWSNSLEDAIDDFKFIHSLNGKKIILKGNHDFWWSTANKINTFLKENGFDDIKILHNNFYDNGKTAICGTRGWIYDGKGEFDKKVISRECGRLEKSISEAIKFDLKPTVFLHYPPAYGEFVCEEIINILEKYNIKSIFYGHIHGSGYNNSLKNYKDIKMQIISCDCIDFTPFFISEY